MTDQAPNLARPNGQYGVDGDYRLIPAPIVGLGYASLCSTLTALAAVRLATNRIRKGIATGAVAALLIAAGASVLRFSRRGKFEVWADLLTGLRLRGDERVLDMGCGRGAVLLAAAKLVPRGKAVGVDIWRADQTSNSAAATWANADAERVADRVELHTRDMTDLEFSDESFDLVVSSLAIHNLPGNRARLSAIDEAVRVLRPGGRIVLADVGFTRLYAGRLQQLGMVDVDRKSLGWRGWWGLPLLSTQTVTATKPSH